jgi:hypothetical protein
MSVLGSCDKLLHVQFEAMQLTTLILIAVGLIACSDTGSAGDAGGDAAGDVSKDAVDENSCLPSGSACISLSLCCSAACMYSTALNKSVCR